MDDSAQKPARLLTPDFVRVVISQMAFGCAISTFLLLPKYLSTGLHASASQIGRMSALPGFTAVLITPLLSGWLDRHGRKPLIAIGAVLAAAHGALWTQVEHLSAITYLLPIMFGMSFVLVFNAAGTLATEAVPTERLGQAIGLFGAANVCMNAVAPSIAEPLAQRFGWNAAFMFSASAALLALLLSRRVHEPAREIAPSPQTALQHARADTRRLLRLASRLRFHTFAMISCGASFGAIFTYYQPFVLSQGAKDVSMFFVGFTLATVGTRLSLGSLADRFGRRPFALYSFIGYACVALSMVGLTPLRLPLFGAAMGCAHGLFYPALSALAIEQTAAHERSRVMTLINGAFHLGNMSSVFCSGWIAEHLGYRPVFVLASIVAWLGVLAMYIEKSRASTEPAATHA